MKKYISILLLVFILLTVSSCGSETEFKDITAVVDSNSPDTTTVMSYDPGLPDIDFGGETFTFAVRGAEGVVYHWNGTDITVEGQNGDVLNDAVYERNTYMEEKYNIKIDEIFCGNTSTGITGSEMSNFIGKSVMSGDSEFDAILTSPYDSIGYATSGYLLDLNSLEYLDLTKQWWDADASASLSIGKKVYITTGELTYIDNKATQCMLFDKKVAEDYNIDDPYKDVRDGKWTLDKFMANSRTVTSDLNGDGIMNENDRFGFIYWQDACFTFICSTGNSIGSINAKGEPELTLYSERMVDVWEKLINFAKEDTCFSILNDLDLMKGSDADTVLVSMLERNHTLYGWATISGAMNMRASNADFGILPSPKYDENQTEYINSPHAYGNTMLTVPVTSDPERTGFILEAFCAKSMEVVTPAFYDKTLISKSVRDEESAEMLDIIFSTKRYDIGYFFMWGNLTNKIMNAWNSLDPNFTSMYDGAKEAALADVQTTKELFADE